MVFRYLLLCLLAWPLTASALPSKECEAALKLLFAKEINQKEAGEFLKLQGDLTLHRLAWAYLKAQKDDQSQKLENVERTILTLLDEKYTSTRPEFIRAREAFESQPLSRTTLAEVGPYLKDILFRDYPNEDQAFLLNASDLKMLHALSKFESVSGKNGKFDSRMLARKSPQGMLNFMKLINSSYKTSTTAEEQALDVEMRLNGLEKTLGRLQNRLNAFIQNLSTPVECTDQDSCELIDMDEYFNQSDEIQKIFWDSLADKLESDDLLLDNLTYGEIWLKTTSPALISSDDSEPTLASGKKPNKTVVAGKVKYSHPSSVRSYYASSTGLYIEDPIAIIIKDKPGRKTSSWKSFDRLFLEKMSDTILNDDKVFEYQGKLFDRKTGKQLSHEQALSKLPPKKRADFLKRLTSKDPAFVALQISAMVNGDSSLVYQGNLYHNSGAPLSAVLSISHEMQKKTGIPHPVSRYQGLDQGFLVERANALVNNKPHFKYRHEVFDSETGRSVTSPFRSTASTQNMSVNKQKRILYQNLSDKEVVINFHRDRPDKNGCQYYAILDKINAEIMVYDLGGRQVFRSEALVGNVRSDRRTVWTQFDEREKMTNRSTGAGIYTVSKPKLNNSYYQRNYSNNILQLLDQNGKDQVFAIHQVPNGMPERNKLFGGDAERRWVSSGCANLRLEDYKKITKWIRPGCQIYVLPEEKNNRLVVKDGTIQMVPEYLPKDSKNYNYNIGSNPKKMDIRIVNPVGRTKASEEFIQALEDEKATLMKVFNLSNEEYSDLASLAYGIMGNESDFGRSKKYWYKENFQGDVIIAKAAKRIWEGKNPFSKSTTNTSRGYTQIKEFPDGAWRQIEKYKHIKKENLGDPKNSAITTMVYLVDAVGQLKNIARQNTKDPRKVQITKENLVDYLGYIYQGRRGSLKSVDDPANADFNTYVQGLRKNMSYIEITQKIE